MAYICIDSLLHQITTHWFVIKHIHKLHIYYLPLYPPPRLLLLLLLDDTVVAFLSPVVVGMAVLSFGFLTRRELLRFLFWLVFAVAVAVVVGAAAVVPEVLRLALRFMFLLDPVDKIAFGGTVLFFEFVVVVATFFVSRSLRLACLRKFSSSCFFCRCNTNAATGVPFPVVPVVADTVVPVVVMDVVAVTPPPGVGFGRA